ncbi:peptidoglycan DD-metalloendopeptidase family protein [Paenibacillus dendritiformis]|uniref:peptidoglycan DD-metalloendopeptidase family protein n=1 Tax=Paenibacillus dendritiformis TaxID=130049 RepID=UPI00387E162D
MSFDWGQYGFRVTSEYGWRNDPFSKVRVWHTGIDLVKAHKSPILAFVPGEVVHARLGVTGSGFGSFGNVVSIKDKDGHLHCYAHLDSISVRVGQKVAKGQEVGKQGSTGRSTGSHLHYEVRSKSSPSYGFGHDINPSKYLENLLGANENKKVKIIVDGKPFDEGILISGKTYVQLRKYCKHLGGKIETHEKTVYVNNVKVVESILLDNYTYVPVRTLEKYLNVQVTGNSKEVQIKSKK